MFAFVISGPVRLSQFCFYRGSIEVRSTERIVQYKSESTTTLLTVVRRLSISGKAFSTAVF